MCVRVLVHGDRKQLLFSGCAGLPARQPTSLACPFAPPPTAHCHYLPTTCPQNRAVANLFKGPNMIEDSFNTLRQLERGDLKLRVRALEAERALTRVAGMQQAVLSALVASMLVNMGTVFRCAVVWGCVRGCATVGFGVWCVVCVVCPVWRRDGGVGGEAWGFECRCGGCSPT